MKKLTLLLGALIIAGATFAGDGKTDKGEKACCKKGEKKECCKKDEKKACCKKDEMAKKEEKTTSTTTTKKS